jgi:hypothetical protein
VTSNFAIVTVSVIVTFTSSYAEGSVVDGNTSTSKFGWDEVEKKPIDTEQSSKEGRVWL